MSYVSLIHRPELLSEWHPTLNEGIDPSTVKLYSSYTKYWWICPVGHAWQACPRTRDRGHGCHVCSGRVVLPETSLLATHSVLCEEWHPSKNGSRTPDRFSFGSNHCAWWICRVCQHEWQARIAGRVNGNGCPACREKKRNKLRTPHGRHVEQRILDFKRKAESRKYEWALSQGEARNLIIGSCFYCALPNCQGIDRRDNNLGYSPSNSVSCCKHCNFAKHSMTEQEFYEWLDRLARYQGYTRQEKLLASASNAG
jgi:hypothetical protein